jgi:hypothetical protein
LIKLTVAKEVENPDYDAQVRALDHRRLYSGDFNMVSVDKFVLKTVLETELTEEEYKAIKKAVLEVKE